MFKPEITQARLQEVTAAYLISHVSSRSLQVELVHVCDNKPASLTRTTQRPDTMQVRAAQMEILEVVQAPLLKVPVQLPKSPSELKALDNTALRQVRPAQMETSEVTQARFKTGH